MTTHPVGAGSRVRLAVVSDAVYPWNTGGKELRHHELLTRLARDGFDVTIYTMKWWDGRGSTEVDGLRYVAIAPYVPLYSGARRSIKQALVFAVCTLRMLVRRFDVVEVDSIPFLPLFPMRVVASLRCRPMVVTWHEYWGVDYWRQYLGRAGSVAGRIEQVATRLPTTIVAASQGTADRLQHDSNRVDVRVVPNGIDRAAIQMKIPAQRSPDQAGVHATRTSNLIVVGRLLDHKKVDVALHAVDELRRRGHRVRLRVIGEGPERARLDELASTLGLGDTTTFESFMPNRDDVLGAIAAADVMLFPTVREGFGMVALESLGLGTPVVTSDASDNFARHLLTSGVNGEVCPPEAREIADAVERVVSSQNRYSRAAVTAAENFDWDVLAKALAGVYAP